MNLQPMKQQNPSRGPMITVYCTRCSGGTSDALADLDAAPGTYYCRACEQYAPITEDGGML
jgi:late competence protein required for DNA uptake (superfamily II DNA/RNA helicase)